MCDGFSSRGSGVELQPTLPGHDSTLQEGRSGVEYEVADGSKIPNLGQKEFLAWTDEGDRRRMKVQVTEVNKALLSVSRIVQAGNRVVFDEEGSYIEDKTTGEWID